MTAQNLDPVFYDVDKTPLRIGPAPTAAQAREASLEYPSDGVTVNGITVV